MTGTLMLMDTAAFEDKGAFFSRVSSQETPVGPFRQNLDTVRVAPITNGRNAHGGIAYIDQAVGGGTQQRDDATVFGNGIRPASVRRAPMNGDFIARSVPVTVRTQGDVGLQRGGSKFRALTPQDTNIPDQGKIVAAFTNPALASLISRWGR